MKKTIAAVGVLLTVLAGCQKGEGTLVKQGMKKAGLVAGAVRPLQPAIDNDIADSVGIIHNRALDAVLAYCKGTGDNSWEGKVQFLNRYFEVPKSVGRPAIIQQAGIIAQSGPNNSADEWIGQMPYSHSAKTLLKAVITTVQQAHQIDLQLLILKLKAVEKQAERSLPIKESVIVRQLSSVARYSAIFWSTYYENHPLPDGEGLWKVLAAIHADNCGFLVGILFGDPEFGAALFSASVGFTKAGENHYDQ